ncbi:MAG TPA: hypothetical protein VJQ82_25885 [Terriglobales bacterium]|nr:hypothetical protein [Terriglobales bacterium]
MAGAVAFDPTTAAPVDAGGFDPSSAQPVESPPPQKTGGATGDFGAPNEGLSFIDKVALSAHDSTEEKEKYLQKVYGKENVRREWGEDGEPQLVLKKDGRQIYISKNGMGFVPETVSQAPELGGMGAGAALGLEVGSPLGPVGAGAGALLGAGLGAMTGHSVKEEAKSLAGTYSKTPEELIGQTVKSGIEGVTGEAGGQLVGKGVSKMLSGRLPSFFTGATDESRAMTKKAWAGGALPPYASMAPDARKLARIEVDAEKLTGKYAAQDTRNQAYVLNEVRKRLEDQGIPNPHLNEIMEQLKNPQFEFSGREAGETLQKSLRAQSQVMEDAVKTSGAQVDKLLDERIANINNIIDKHPPGALAEDVEAMVRNAKKQFSDWATVSYDKIDQMLGGRPVVPVEPIREAARQIKSQLPRTAVSAMTKELAAMGKEGVTEEDAVLIKEFGIELPKEAKIPIKDAQRIRTLLREKGDAQALTRSTIKGDHLYLSNAVDNAIQAAAEDPSAAVAIRALNATDAAYKKGIAKFNDITFKQIVKSTRSGMPPDPEKIASLILQPGQTAKVGTLRKVVGEEVWKRVQSADLKNLMNATTSVNVVGNRTVDGLKLLEQVNQRRDLIKAVHGDQAVLYLEELGKSLAARKGVLQPEALMNGDLKGALTQLRANEKALDDHLKTNLLAELADLRRTGEDVYRWVVEPGKETRVMQVAKQFGEDSPQMAEIRQAALEELARNANIKAIDEKGNQALESALAQFTKRQQELLFPDGLSNDIRDLSKVIKFIYPFKSGVVRDVGMAGMHAGAVLEKPLKVRLYKQAVAAITRFIALHPTIARWVVTGRDPNTPWIENSARIIEGLTRAEIMDQTSDLPDQPNGAPNGQAETLHQLGQANGRTSQPSAQ